MAEGKTDEAHLLFCDAQMHWGIDKNQLLSTLDKGDISAAENLLGSLYATLKQRILLFKSQAAPGPISPPAFSSGKEIPTIETGEMMKEVRSTPSEYSDNELMKEAVEREIKSLLINPDRGLTADNIGYKFYDHTFSFVNKAGEKKSFNGKTLLAKRRKSRTKAGMIALLKELGVKVEGELTIVTEAEFADNELMKKAINEGIRECLVNLSEELTADNISSYKFAHCTFNFINEDGVEKSFVGATLLIQRKKDCSKTGIIALLKELNIEIAGKSAVVTNAEFADKELEHV